jgi:hypothetical protein
MNYWILFGSPDKWFCDDCKENVEVNNILRTLKKQVWKVKKEYFKDAKIDDKCIIKINKDNRSIEKRTLKNGEVVDVLESGIYAIGKIIKELFLNNQSNDYEIEIEITTNLFKNSQIIDDEMSEKILGNDYFSNESQKIDKAKYEHVLSLIQIEEYAKSDKLEGDSGFNNDGIDEEMVYPAEVKIQRDMFSVRELKTDYEDKMLILAPDFQREFVWKLKQKSELIESILMGIPLPMIYFFEGDSGIIQVVDGKQRLTSLFEFLDDKFPLSHSLSILPKLRGKKYSELLPAERTKIARYQFVTQTIIPPTPDKIKFDIFERVNRKGTTLNNQEMRNALYQGKATKLLEKLSTYKSFQKATDGAISPTRMKDRYMILRVLAFYLWKHKQLKLKNGEVVDYKSDIDEFLGKTMQFINQSSQDILDDICTEFDKSMKISFKLRGKDGFRIPSSERKRPINMALMESLSYLYTQIKDSQMDIVKKKIEDLFNEEEFITAITQRVDSSVSVKARFNKMDNILEELKQ